MHQVLADVVLAVHAAFVVFVVAGLIVVIAGNLQHWQWVNRMWFRIAHLLAIAVVAAQAWLGQACPLTRLELWLRARAGQAVYDTSFVQYWLERLLYYQAPGWVFTLVYTLFGLAVVVCWWRYPPQR
jgi:hypothetical protein